MSDVQKEQSIAPEQVVYFEDDEVVYTRNDDVIFDQERGIIDSLREEPTTRGHWGLALSGGGIRSASFSLGVLQALVNARKLSEFDYLSTVSGGGYIGTSLSWFLRNKEFGTTPELFPFGRPTYREDEAKTDKTAERERRDEKSNRILDFIRQNASYLTPGGGLNLLSLVAVAMRGIFVSLLVYGTFLVVIMKFVAMLEFFAHTNEVSYLWGRIATFPVVRDLPFALTLALGIVALLVVGAIWFIITRGQSYERRVRGQKVIGLGWTVVFVLGVLGTVPIVSDELRNWFAGGLTGLGGIAGAITVLREKPGNNKKSPFATLIPQIAAGALIYGLVLAAYSIIGAGYAASTDNVTTYVVVGVVALALSVIASLNYVGHHGIYRDRLMELFMPDDAAIDTGRWHPAEEAQNYAITCLPDQRPYHLINTNVVLIDSDTRQFRDRGGDSFVLSRHYCGSQATGWWTTEEFTRPERFLKSPKLTLASAMAISAAAADPNTGAAGRGPTRGRLVSTLMTLLNIRLGFWVIGPRTARRKRADMLVPGLWALLGLGFKEQRTFLELTDGGHFDNTGVYELLRRKNELIVLADGSADSEFRFGDLANVIERARVDFRAKIRFEDDLSLDGLLPGSSTGKDSMDEKFNLAERGFALATITYDNGKVGKLLYLKTTLTRDLPADVYGYRADNPDFPDQSTGDQFFDERQFEAYRELGYQLTKKAMDDEKVKKSLEI